MSLDTMFERHVEEASRAVADAVPPPLAEMLRARKRRRRGLVLAATTLVGTVLLVGLLPSLLLRGAPPATERQGTAEEALGLPTSKLEWPSYEMLFQLEDGSYGRILWVDTELWMVDRLRWEGGTPARLYMMFKQGSQIGLDDRAQMLGFEGAEERALAPHQYPYPPDPEVPYQVLLTELAPAQAWAHLPGDAPARPTSPLHPEAASAAEAPGGLRLEVTADGIPVLVAGGGWLEFEAVALDRRPVDAAELEPSSNLSLDYTIFLAGQASESQRPLLADGIVTWAEYQAAAADTVDCIGSGDPDAQVSVEEQGGTITIDTRSPALEGCRERHLAQVEEAWRVQSTRVTDIERVSYLIQGDTEMLAVYEAEPEDQVHLGSGDGWSLVAYRQGPGICERFSAGSTSGEGCNLPSRWQVPEILSFGYSYGYGPEGFSDEAELHGFVSPDAASVSVRFSRLGRVSLEVVGEETGFPYLGFGLAFDPRSYGLPALVEVYAADGRMLGSYEPLQCETAELDPSQSEDPGNAEACRQLRTGG